MITWMFATALFLFPLVRDFIVDDVLKKNEDIKTTVFTYLFFWITAIAAIVYILSVGG